MCKKLASSGVDNVIKKPIENPTIRIRLKNHAYNDPRFLLSDTATNLVITKPKNEKAVENKVNAESVAASSPYSAGPSNLPIIRW